MTSVKDLFRRVVRVFKVEDERQDIGDQISKRVAEMVAKLEADGLSEGVEFEAFTKMDSGYWMASGSVEGRRKGRTRFEPSSHSRLVG